MEIRKLGVWIVLFLLLVVPFFNWQLGALFWMCAFLVYVLQQVFSGNPFTVVPKQEDFKEDEEASSEQENHKDN